MSGRVKFILMFLILALTITLVGCKPIAYYLQQVDKAYGKVTDAATGVPLESVDVLLGDYQYSELTNGLGDYELELAEGTWTLHFIKDGYVTLDKGVTVSASNPRVKVDAQLTRVAPPSSWMVGSWVMDAYYYYLPGDDLTVINTDGTIQMLDNYDGSGPVLHSGEWSLDGNVWTLTGFMGPVAQVQITKVNNDLFTFDSPDGTRTQYFYRKGTQPGVSAFDYAPATPLSLGVATDGVFPALPIAPPPKMQPRQLVLYTFTAPTANSYDVRLQNANVSACKADKVTTLLDDLQPKETPASVSMGTGELIFLIVVSEPGGTFNISVESAAP